MVKLTKRDLAIIGAAVGTADFLAEGRLSAPLARALKKYVVPRAAAAVPRLATTGFQVAKQIALRHPVLTGGAIVYYTYKNRKEIGRLVEQGYDVLQQDVLPRFEGSGIPFPAPPKPTLRKVSKFNRAVSAGMKAAKGSRYYGKKGVLSSPKKAFAAVTKIASKLSKGKKVSRTGSSGVIARAMPKWGTGPRSGR